LRSGVDSGVPWRRTLPFSPRAVGQRQSAGVPCAPVWVSDGFRNLGFDIWV